MLRLEFICILKAEFLYLGLAFRTFLPIDLRTFVASDMYIFRREELSHFGENILEECHCLLISGTENLVSNAPSAPYVIWSVGTSEVRICGQGGKHMSWKVDFRYDLDALCSGIINDFPDLLLREPAAFSVRRSVIFIAFEDVADDGLLPD